MAPSKHKLYPYSQDESVTKEDENVIVNMWWRRLAIILLLVSISVLTGPAHAATEPARYALVIGNGSYPDQPLGNPVNDANLMADTLRALGFNVFKHTDLSQKGMRRAIRDFGDELEKAGDDAVSLIFYAGHGLQVDGQNYLVPVDAQIRSERDVAVEAVSANAMLDMLAYSDTGLNIVILDACRNNPFQRKSRSSASRGLARMDAPSGTILAYATAPGQVAADGDGRNSPYTRALVRSMSQPDKPIEEMFKRVRIEVMDRSNGEQIPWESSSLTGDFYFSRSGKTQKTENSAADGAETLFWSSIVAENNPALFEAYLNQYPDGMFAPIAKSRIASLQQAAEQPEETIVASASLAPVQSSELQFVPGSYRLEPIVSESECRDIRFGEVDFREKGGEGYWRHPQTGGDVKYKIEDGIVSVEFKGSMINSVKDTVQIKGRDLFIRLRISYTGGNCKIAYYLRDIMAAN